ncbi:NHL repeat-containing protein [Candidatus Uhrbacteria bacterium]|nr:NHL repeat-containing protein [Candidatus Uhrbacteria bacterium]
MMHLPAKRNVMGLAFAVLLVVLMLASNSFRDGVRNASATISDGANATAVLGQFDSDGNPTYTTAVQAGLENNAFNSPTDIALDATGHRLFVLDQNRVLVFTLSSSNILTDYVADAVLGRPTLVNRDCDGASASTFCPGGALAYSSTTNRLFVTDSSYNRVLVFDVASITNGENAIAVLGQTNFTNTGTGTTASTMNTPYSTLIDDTNSRLFVTDGGNHRVLVFDVASITNGESATAVLGQSDFTSGNAATTQSGMRYPYGMIWDATNTHLFVADTGNHRVLVFDLSSGITNGMNAWRVLGQANFTSGDYNFTQNRMRDPNDVVWDSTASRLFVSDYSNHRVLVFNLASGITDGMNAANVLGQTDFTTVTSGLTASKMSNPRGMQYDAAGNRLFLTDYSNNRALIFDVAAITDGENATGVLVQIDSNGDPTFTTNSSGYYAVSNRTFNGSVAIAVDTVNHRLFVGDTARVLVFNLTSANALTDTTADYVLGQTNFSILNSGGLSQSAFNAAPNGLTFDTSNSRLFVSDSGNNRVLVFDLSGGITNGMNAANVLGQANFTSGGIAATQSGMDTPSGLAWDATNGRLFVSEMGNSRVLVFDLSGGITNGMNAWRVLGQSTFTTNAAATTASGMSSPAGVTWDATNGRLFVSDSINCRVLVFDLSGSITNGMNAAYVLGQTNFTSGARDPDPGPAVNNLNYPGKAAFDSMNTRLLVADAGYNRVVTYHLAGGITNGMNASNVLGQSVFTTVAAGTTQAKLNFPYDLAYVPSSGDLFIGDVANYRVLVFDASIAASGAPLITDATPPALPTQFAVRSTNEGIQLLWMDPPDTDLSTLRILRMQGASARSLSAVRPGVQEFMDTSADLTPGTMVAYALQVIDTSGNRAISDVQSITVRASLVSPTTPAAAAPLPLPSPLPIPTDDPPLSPDRLAILREKLRNLFGVQPFDALSAIDQHALLHFLAFGNDQHARDRTEDDRLAVLETFHAIFPDRIPTSSLDQSSLELLSMRPTHVLHFREFQKQLQKATTTFYGSYQRRPTEGATTREEVAHDWRTMRILAGRVESVTRDIFAERAALRTFLARDLSFIIEGLTLHKESNTAPYHPLHWQVIRSCVYGNPEKCDLLPRMPPAMHPITPPPTAGAVGG